MGFDDGYVAVDGTATIEFSPDGTTWTAIRLPPGDGFVVSAAVAADGPGVIIVGGYSPCSDFSWAMEPPATRCRMRPFASVSEDGLTWRSSVMQGESDTRSGSLGSRFSAVWSVPSGGWEVAEVVLAYDGQAGEVCEVGPALWHSDDGEAWSSLRPLTSTRWSDCESAAGFWALVDGEGHHVALESDDGASRDVLAISPDGRQYSRLGSQPSQDGDRISEGLPPIDSGPWVFVGTRPAAGAVGWASEDLEDWTSSLMPLPDGTVTAMVRALGHGNAGYVAAGRALGETEGAGQAVTWLSDDGMTWRIGEVGTPAWDWIGAIAHGPAGTMAFGVEDGTTTVWRLQVVARPTVTPPPVAAQLAVADVARLAGLPDGLLPTCVDSAGAFHGLAAVGSAIRCSSSKMTIEVATVSMVDEWGETVLPWDVWYDLFFSDIVEEEGFEEWHEGCSPRRMASYSDYAVGSRFAGTIGGCTDEGWLLWTVDEAKIIGRVEAASGQIADAVAWFRGTRPVGNLKGLLWDVPWGSCTGHLGCDGPLPNVAFEKIWQLAQPMSHKKLARAAERQAQAGQQVPERQLPARGELVRFTGRIVFESDEAYGVQVRQPSSGRWGHQVVIGSLVKDERDVTWDLYEHGRTFEFVGWVSGLTGWSEDGDFSAPDNAEADVLPLIDVAVYRVSR